MISTANLITDLRSHIGVESTDVDWTDPICLGLLNRSYWELNNKFSFREQEGRFSFPTAVGTDTYLTSLLASDFDSIQSISVLDPNLNTTTKLARTTVEDLESLENYNSSSQARPTHYYRRFNTVVIWPIPDQVYTLSGTYLINLTDLTNSTTNPLPQEWHEVILFGGIWRAQLQIGDLERSNATLNYQRSIMNTLIPVESKEENDSRESSVQVFTGYGNYYNNTPSRKLWR